jgi:hypothetical protein
MLQLDWEGFYVFSHIDQTENWSGNNRKYMFLGATLDCHAWLGLPPTGCGSEGRKIFFASKRGWIFKGAGVFIESSADDKNLSKMAGPQCYDCSRSSLPALEILNDDKPNLDISDEI